MWRPTDPFLEDVLESTHLAVHDMAIPHWERQKGSLFRWITKNEGTIECTYSIQLDRYVHREEDVPNRYVLRVKAGRTDPTFRVATDGPEFRNHVAGQIEIARDRCQLWTPGLVEVHHLGGGLGDFVPIEQFFASAPQTDE